MIDIYTEIVRMRNLNEDGMLVTVIHKKGNGPAIVGRKMLVKAGGETLGTVGGGELELRAAEKARELLNTGEHLVQSYSLSDNGKIEPSISLNMICGGSITLYYEYLPVIPAVYIVGAGHIGKSLVRYLENLDFQLTVVDSREEMVQELNRTNASVRNWSQALEHEDLKGSYIVVCTPSHADDFQVLKSVYRSKNLPRYLGVVASPSKARAMATRLLEEFNQYLDFSMLFSPAGLDIGGNSPEEIALSIVSEIQAIRYKNASGKHLSETWYT
ncbi:MAG: XdhC family protein [Chitinophagales bacterium]